MKQIYFWIIAFVITLFSAYYQRISGPTYPKKQKFIFYDTTINFKLLRSFEQDDAPIKINIPNELDAKLYFRKYPSTDSFEIIKFNKSDSNQIALLPKQAPAGKLQYYIIISSKDKIYYTNESNPVVIRFKGRVPKLVLIIHIIFIFATMLFANITGLFAIFKKDKQKILGQITLMLLLIGGAIFGPIVQKFAFGHFWTGIPLGWDLTDNKTLVALIAWILAVVLNLKKQRRWITIVAAILTLIIFAIPHSLFGSQLNYNTGKVIQGFLLLIVSINHLNFKK